MIAIYDLHTVPREEILSRKRAGTPPEVEASVAEILEAVRLRGDAAVLEYGARFGGAELTALRVDDAELETAAARCAPALLSALEQAAENIRAFHKEQLRPGFRLERPGGVILGQRVLPLDTVGIYVPGGTAAYPSTVLMDAIPAALAGVRRVVMATPCGGDGRINDAVLAAAKIAGVTDIFKMGGAQAVAALAFGTESVPKVDKIVGPGNIYVATAKRQVFGLVDIDMIAGPSEILVLADGAANPRHVAADLLSQAEHDVLASAVLVCDSMNLARAVAAELERQVETLPRREIARASLENNGRILVCRDLAEAVDMANLLAPEHLELCVAEPFALLEQVRNAGSVFLGRYAPEALGDYWAGPNHTLPTLGTARFSSPLSVEEFVKRSSYIYYTPEALAGAKDAIGVLARQEGLEAHARSVESRFED